ncbi:MAG: hypothetical protein A2X35_11715 [Elusimicrobia bacterium GWA2_61_42]|nr:MAG: hypothetical protein A2X35_11715 [Elusimicrobia bacterium GWA2_61_42]
MRTFVTPGYLKALSEHSIDSPALYAPGSKALNILSKGGDPSWVVGDPTVQVESGIQEDDGRTLKVPSSFSFYAVRDDHEADCSCGCGGGSVVTFMLPEEY